MMGGFSSRTPGTADETEARPHKRTRTAIACQRCKQRKQRCDNSFPSCSNCRRAGAGQSCAYGVADKAVYPPEYVASLEAQITQLKQKLQTHRVSGAESHPAGSKPATQHPNSTKPDVLRSNIVEYSRPSVDFGSRAVEPVLEAGTGIVALSSSTPGGAYLGDSSGRPLARIIQTAITDSILRRGIALSHETRDAGDHGSVFANATMPSQIVADKILAAYIQKVHSKHPFLSKSKLRQLNQLRHELQPSSSPGSRVPAGKRLDFFMLHMVFAIGARYLQLSWENGFTSPEAHYASALLDIDLVFDVQSITNLQCMLLLALYQLRSPSGPGLWSMIGLVMRHCLDAGLHRKSQVPILEDQQRKRLFWTVYMLERSVARTLGRPCCVTDREIDIELPANVSDEIEDESELLAAIEHASQHPYQSTALSPAIHIVKIQRIESKIHRTLYRVDKSISAMDPQKIVRLRAELENWRAQIWNAIPPACETEAVPYNMSEYHMIQYYKSILLLHMPFLPSLTPSEPDFRLCAHAAGQVCQLYKLLHDKQQYISYSLLALHASFVAGLVLVYCFSKDKSIFDAKFSSDIRACSTVLYIIAERWPATCKVKSAFESLVAATIEGDSAIPISRSSLSVNTLEIDTAGSLHMPDLSQEMNVENDIWQLFETVLDERDHNFRWTQEGIFNAMNAFPEYGWSL